MKKLLIIILVLGFAFRASAQSSAKTDSIKLAANSKDISVFVNTAKAAGLINNSNGLPITVFIPDNKAMQQLPVKLLDSLTNPVNKYYFTSFFNNNAISGNLTAKSIAAQIKANNGQAVLTTLVGRKLTVSINENRNFVLTDENGISAVVKVFNLQQGNTTIFIVNSVLNLKL